MVLIFIVLNILECNGSIWLSFKCGMFINFKKRLHMEWDKEYNHL